MKALAAKANAIARAAQQRRVADLARDWRERLPDALVSTGASEVFISAHGLAKRWLADSGLRFVGREKR